MKYARVSVNDVVAGDIICRKTGELFTVARITTPDWETLAFHSEDDEIRYSAVAYVEVLRPEPWQAYLTERCLEAKQEGKEVMFLPRQRGGR